MENNCDLTLLEPVLEKYAGQKENLITVLQKTQEIYGYLPKAALYLIAERTGRSPAQVMGVATFYAQFTLNPVGKYLIMLCRGTACHVNSSEAIARAITEKYGIEDGETTPDGLFTLKHVACLGCCSLSPVMTVNGEVYGSLTPQSAIKILDDIKAGEGAL
ncbi:MAG: NADH-quinone oxidoreductase subunit NuoE [Clostridia bacterium]|nr:NADH-quinone oxidoreductase subunit NuoE [Clostridia bacterium]